MAELDVFDARFAAAYRRYLDEVPTEVDAAAMARAAATARPRARWAWRGALRTAPALAWLALLGLLLAALTAGLVVIGSQLQRDHPAVVLPVATGSVQPPAATANPVVERTAKPADPAYVCPPGSNPDEPGPVDQARPDAGSTTAIAFDRRAGRLIVHVIADGIATRTAVETWTFDVCTNSWTRMHPDQEPAGVDEWDLFVYDVDSDVTVAVDRQDGSVWAYDLETDTWARRGKGPIDARLGAYDPVSGLVVVARDADPAELWDYDVETDTWTPIPLANGGRASVFGGGVAYDASVDRLVVYTGEFSGNAETWLLDLRTGAWTRSGAATPDVVGWLTAPTMAYDEAAKRTAVLQRIPLTAYDATADRWVVVPEAGSGWPHPGWPYPSRMVFDPVNDRLIGMSEWRGTPDIDIPPGGVEALHLATGERTVLLEPGGR